MLGLRLDSATQADLIRVARREGKTKSEVVRDALRTYLAQAQGDADLIAQVRTIAALTTGPDLEHLDDLQDDLEQLLDEEEAKILMGKAA